MNVIKRANKLLSEGQVKEAINLLEKDATHETAFEIGKIYGNKEYKDTFDESKAFNIFANLAKKNFPPAQYRLGLIYANGEYGKDFNYNESDGLFRQVANIQDENLKDKYFEYVTKSCLEIAKIYDSGYTGDVDKREALRYFKRACENQSLVYAFYKAGELILELDTKNYSEALNYLDHSNNKNDTDSIRLSSKIYIKLIKNNLKNLIGIDPNSVDYKIILNKLNDIDEDIL